VIEKDPLLTIAGVSVGLAGFSAIVGLLGSRSGRSDVRVDALRLQVMLETSLTLAAHAFVPVLVSIFDLEASASWRISAAAWLAIGIPSEIIAWRRTRNIPELKLNQLNVNTVNWGLAIGCELLMLLVAIGWFGSRAGALYLVARFSYLLVAGILFVQFASSTFVPTDRSGRQSQTHLA